MRLWILLGAVCAIAAAATITEENLRSAQDDPGVWLMYGKNYSAWRYGDLNQINTGNIAKLAPRWMFQTGAGALETAPLVFDGLPVGRNAKIERHPHAYLPCPEN